MFLRSLSFSYPGVDRKCYAADSEGIPYHSHMRSVDMSYGGCVDQDELIQGVLGC